MSERGGRTDRWSLVIEAPARAVFDALVDPALAGTMTMTWSLRDEPGGVRVTVEASDVPDGIGRADHEAGLRSTLEQLAAYVAA